MNNTKPSDSRRDFLQKAGSICGMAFLTGSALLQTGCASLPVVRTAMDGKTLKVPFTAFVESKAVIVRNSSLEYDILLIKSDAGYNALQMKCTHHDVGLNATAKGLHCNDHGSNFDLEGKVVLGPAKRNLKTYPVITGTDSVVITF